MADKIQLQVKRLPHCKGMPCYAEPGAAGMDLVASIEKSMTVSPRASVVIPTGICVAIPEGWEGQVRGRSGHAFRAQLSITHGVGTVDSSYRGQIMVLITNHGDLPYTFEPGERVAQMILSRAPQFEIVEVEELDETARGEGGFGSTGRTQAVKETEALVFRTKELVQQLADETKTSLIKRVDQRESL